jgi:hypothetical protein
LSEALGLLITLKPGAHVGVGVRVAVRVDVGVAVEVEVAVGTGSVLVGVADTTVVEVEVAVLVGVAIGPDAATQFENSEVLPSGSMAIDVTTSPLDTVPGKVMEKDALLLLLVVAEVSPRNHRPSPWLDGSQPVLLKKCKR